MALTVQFVSKNMPNTLLVHHLDIYHQKDWQNIDIFLLSE